MSAQNVLIFGATGAIGAAILIRFTQRGDQVIAVSRSGKARKTCGDNVKWIRLDEFQGSSESLSAVGLPRIDSVVWAQGANCSDDIYDFDLEQHEALYAANVSYILSTLQCLLRAGLLAKGARLCVISSIWQNIARQKKLSYCITKSALQGLVQSLAIDLGPSGYLINAVLPGALDTPMTRANLAPEQIKGLEASTPLGSLPTLSDVYGLVEFLCSAQNTGITGQFIAADRGFSYARIV